MRPESSRSTGLASRDSGTSGQSTAKARVRFPTPQASDWKNKNYSRDFTLGNVRYVYPELTLSVAASRARTSAMQARKRGSRARGRASGKNLPGSLAWFDRSTCSWRTWWRSEAGGWEPFLGTWPRAGTMRHGIAYRLQPLAPLTRGTGSLYLLGRWPTPKAGDAEFGLPRTTGRPIEKVTHLATAARYWPTPQARDYRTGQFSRWQQARKGTRSRNLNDQVGGQLNPTWVEWLMGFPLGWTESVVSEMRSSRRSRKQSAT